MHRIVSNLTVLICETVDATCVCPSSSSDICVAQSILSLTPTVNQLFNANLSTHTVATALWNTQGAPLNGNCAYQAIVIDVGPSLQVATSPNRTAWARSALLWQLVQTVDLSIISDLQSFIGATDFSQLSQDGPVQDPSSKFNSTSAGFNFDFASQTVAHPAVSWKTTGQPSSAQISQVNDIASGALDRMYSFAVGKPKSLPIPSEFLTVEQHPQLNSEEHCRSTGNSLYNNLLKISAPSSPLWRDPP